MKKIILSTIISCSLVSSVFAFDCPTPSAVSTAGFDMVQQDKDGNYFVGKQSDFDTQEQWSFYITGIQASSADEALDKAKEAMATSFTGDSQATYYQDHWYCNYYDTGYQTFAISPPPANHTPIK